MKLIGTVAKLEGTEGADCIYCRIDIQQRWLKQRCREVNRGQGEENMCHLFGELEVDRSVCASGK